MIRPIATPLATVMGRRQAAALLALGGWSLPALAQTTTATPHTDTSTAASEAALEAKAPPVPPLGSTLRVPDMALLDGTPFQAPVNQPLLIYWWASTCPFCALQSPSMQALWQSQKSRGLKMLALSVDKTPKVAADYLQKRGYTFPAAWASPAWRRLFAKPKGLPITLLLNAQQQVVLAEKGQMFAEDVEAIAGLI